MKNLSMTKEGKKLNELQVEMFGKKTMRTMHFKEFIESDLDHNTYLKKRHEKEMSVLKTMLEKLLRESA